VWDTIAEIESGKVHDGTLVTQMKEFKRSFMERQVDDASPSDIREAWTEWKVEHDLVSTEENNAADETHSGE